MSFKDFVMNEMAYPVTFNMEGFKNLKSYKNRLRYAQEMLLGKLGKGSSRAVFNIDNTKVLKVAINDKGVAQNEAESEYFKQNYDSVARVFDSDDEEFTWLEMEYAKKVTPKRFQTITGVSLQDLGSYLGYIKNRSRTYRLDDATIEKIGNDEGFIGDLIRLATDYDYVLPGDFQKASSYGEVSRDGKPTIVIIDFGFTQDVADTFYRRQF